MILRIRWLAGLLGYVIFIQYIYATHFAPAFGYLGYYSRSPELFSYSISLGIALALVFTLPSRLDRPSSFILWFLYVICVLPSIAATCFADVLPVSEVLRVNATFAACFALVALGVRSGPVLRLRIRVTPRQFWIGVLSFTLFVHVYLLLKTGFRFHLVSLVAVAQTRFGYRTDVAASGPLLGYLVQSQGFVITPLLLAKGIYSRRITLVLAAIVSQGLLYSLTGYRTVILALPATAAVAVLYSMRRRPYGSSLLWGTLGACLIAVGADAVARTSSWKLLLVDRLVLSPAVKLSAYVDIFSQLPKARWGYSFLSGFVDYPYSVSPSFVVGTVFSNRPNVSANANLFADGFANYGYTGMLIESIVLVVVLWFLDGALRRVPMPIVCSLLLLPAIALANSSVFTSITSHGILLAMIVGVFMPRNGWARQTIGQTEARVRRSPQSITARSL